MGAKEDSPTRVTSLCEPRHDSLRSVGTAMEILSAFIGDEELGVSDLARRVGIAKSTAHRLLSTLRSGGMVEQNPETGRYRLGLRILELGFLAKSRMELRRVAMPALERARAMTHHAVHLGVVDGSDIVYAERLTSPETLPLLEHVSRRWPAHRTSSGKVIVAFRPELEATVRAQLAGTGPHAVAEYERSLAETRRLGVGLTLNHVVQGVGSVAAPILDLSGRAVGAVSLVAPAERMRADLDRNVRIVMGAAGHVSRSLKMAS